MPRETLKVSSLNALKHAQTVQETFTLQKRLGSGCVTDAVTATCRFVTGPKEPPSIKNLHHALGKPDVKFHEQSRRRHVEVFENWPAQSIAFRES